MNLLRKPGAIAVAALALAVLPSAAEAHDGSHPFVNCTDAYENGYANIPKGNEHYGTHLDRDGDGIGCDSPPAGFEPAADEEAATTDENGTDLAETGGEDITPYIAAGGMSVLLAGTALTVFMNRRRAAR
ncbi:excalibur calcium-binding domain-containing protein [Streptomyces sp. S.PB5]|uniref:excalibur calcium-binding domain-containing protein n=1 Tax=Streptomyces sp. S.PB5 TaxID=3020844 RepID=UPI0025B1A98C|nr:excalibur calcium-binding domain-containing protein [Streptomyces sp. S.PB5]MDN3020367.1 excalibur calcium-binding domain-containing protein [Streptomyces sp. S.PB5]